jgi:hypothetical protein
MEFLGTTFSTPDVGPWVASKVLLNQIVLSVRGRIAITASKGILASGLHVREGAHLVLYCPSVDLSDSEFLRRSIVSSPPVAEGIPYRRPPEPPSGDSPPQRARAVAATVVAELEKRLTDDLADSEPETRCKVMSLKGANVGELVLSDVVLDDCEFVGALGLDKLRVGPGCSFRWTGKWWNWPPMASRRIFKEEDSWREAHSGRVKAGSKKVDFLPAPDIAEIYRDLRKGLEEGKNEPGAADFYYSQIEMRRLAARGPRPAAQLVDEKHRRGPSEPS